MNSDKLGGNMSEQAAKKYLERLEADPKFKKLVEKAKDKKEAENILREHGYIFTKEELKKAAKAVLGKELTEKELILVAGGKKEMFNTSIEG